GVMLGLENCDDHAFGQLLKVIGQTGRLPEMIESGALRAQIARGLGLEAVPKNRSGLEAAVYSTLAVPALGYDLAFPEVFYPLGVPHGREGFHAVLGNPPWDRMLPADKEFFASFEFAILDAPTKRERDVIRQRLLTDPDIGHRYDSYIAEFRGYERVLDSQFEHQIVEVAGERTIGKQDAYRAFMERNTQLLATGGWTGVVVPSAFHANEGATGVRRIYLQRMNFRHCYS